jgi:hypothetical protein
VLNLVPCFNPVEIPRAMGWSRFQIAWHVGSNSGDSSSDVRPDRTKSTICAVIPANRESMVPPSQVKKCPPNRVNSKSGAPVGNAASMSESGHRLPSVGTRGASVVPSAPDIAAAARDR